MDIIAEIVKSLDMFLSVIAATLLMVVGGIIVVGAIGLWFLISMWTKGHYGTAAAVIVSNLIPLLPFVVFMIRHESIGGGGP